MTDQKKWVLVTGATGRQGGAVARHLLKNGWKVKALTRNPDQPQAKALRELGADILKGNLNNTRQIRYFFEGVWGVFSVQNPWISGIDKEIEQGMRVAKLCKDCEVSHLVYSSAGPGAPGTGVPHFESKVQIEKTIRSLDLPCTILRPAGFMEMMTDRDFFPELVAWNVTAKVMGPDFPLSWIACDDIGAVAARVFAGYKEYIGKELMLTGDVKSIRECLEIYRKVHGRNPKRIPAPVWLFRLMQKDLYQMYSWMKQSPQAGRDEIERTRLFHPELMNVEEWMRSLKEEIKSEERLAAEGSG